MALDAARLPARLDAAGDLNPLAHHDRTMWDAALIGEGLALLERSARGGVVSRYHVEAAIAAAHASAPDLEATDWPLIVSLYDRLLAIAPTPVVALSRALAIAERDGAAAGLAAIDAIEGSERLARYPFYPAALAEMHLRLGDLDVARRHFIAARALARNEAERRFLDKRLTQCAAQATVRTALARASNKQTTR